MKILKHPNIVEMKDFFWDDGFVEVNYKMKKVFFPGYVLLNLNCKLHRHIYIAMEYCNGGDLSHFIKRKHKLAENVCRQFLQQLALALKYLRNHNVCHMDLKPQNLLLTRTKEITLKVAGSPRVQLFEFHLISVFDHAA